MERLAAAVLTAPVQVGLVMEQCLAPVPGGTGRYAAELAAALARGAQPGAAVVGWTAWHRDVRPGAFEGVQGPRRLPLGRRALAAAWERGRGPVPRHVDVVHAPTLLVPPRAGRPLVVTVHDTVPWTHPETLTARGVAFHRRMAERAAREADLVVVPTAAVANELAEILRLGDRVRVVGEGASEALRPPSDALDRARRLALPPAYVLTVATFEPRKGLDRLLAAMAHAAAPDVPLLVAGQPGWGDVDPPAEAARLGLAPERVRVLGRLADADLAVAYAQATVVAVPSRAEGFGLPLLEAMAAGTPVVVTDVPALVEVSGGAARVVPADDVEALAVALAAVVADDTLRGAMAAAGRERARAFSWEHAATLLWAAYDLLV